MPQGTDPISLLFQLVVSDGVATSAAAYTWVTVFDPDYDPEGALLLDAGVPLDAGAAPDGGGVPIP